MTTPAPVTVTGWGLDVKNQRTVPNILLHKIELKTEPPAIKCVNKKSERNFDVSSRLLMLEPTKGSQKEGLCKGDSGGPWVVKTGNRYYSTAKIEYLRQD